MTFQKLAYLASVGYSGSTLLSLILQSNTRVSSVGEIWALARHARDGFPCTCQEPLGECEFWKPVLARIRQEIERPDLEFVDFPLTPPELSQDLRRRLPTSADLLLVLGSRMAWATLAPRLPTARLYHRGAENARHLYEAVCAVHDTSIVWDSSKYALPLKANYLSLPHGQMKVVFLVRDGRAVTRSMMKRQGRSFDEAAHRWRRYNWNLELVMRSIPDRDILFLRYEDFCRSPAQETKRLSKFLGIEDLTVPTALPKRSSHDVGGNPMRFRRGEVKIELNEKWKDEISATELKRFDEVAGKMNRRFGYD